MIVLGIRATGVALASDKWTFSISESSPDRTYLTIRIASTQASGDYHFEIGGGKINDDSGNVRTSAITFDFTIV